MHQMLITRFRLGVGGAMRAARGLIRPVLQLRKTSALTHLMRIQMFTAAFVAMLIGYGSTIALVLAAAAAVGATPMQTASWVAAVSVAKGIGSAGLSLWTRIPIVLAWSTPGAALIAASTGVTMPQAVGAFVVTGLMILATGAIPSVTRAVTRIPAPMAAAMLGGVLLPFCMATAQAATAAPTTVLPIIAAFLIMRLIDPLYAVLAALATGIATAAVTTTIPLGTSPFAALPFTFITPEFTLPTIVGLALPLYLVTMASQNLPGFAVLQAQGYTPPVAKSLGVTGAGSAIAGLFGAHTFNMAALTAAICLTEDVHPDRTQRWKVGLVYGAFWVIIGLAGSLIVPAITAMPPEIITTIAGLALITPMMTAVAAAFEAPTTRFPAAATFLITASGMSAFGIGAAFWGLVVGLIVLGSNRLARSSRS